MTTMVVPVMVVVVGSRVVVMVVDGWVVMHRHMVMHVMHEH